MSLMDPESTARVMEWKLWRRDNPDGSFVAQLAAYPPNGNGWYEVPGDMEIDGLWAKWKPEPE